MTVAATWQFGKWNIISVNGECLKKKTLTSGASSDILISADKTAAKALKNK